MKKKPEHCSSYDCEGEADCICACQFCLTRRRKTAKRRKASEEMDAALKSQEK